MELMVRTLGIESEGRAQRHAFSGGFTDFFLYFFNCHRSRCRRMFGFGDSIKSHVMKGYELT